ncbi:hypothetical protein K8B33_01720 [Alcanivorax sp. JB21]|uniref:DUF7931 domain-containing protein n=1 Tax=Alcanivorax limicola TaxID=2874102 RepID=UPI001CC01D9B|nr:hypothetical protein [Alcanivorax limicola]MBZ2187805.1 hypothetical protein [Alcanivorax limicola]
MSTPPDTPPPPQASSWLIGEETGQHLLATLADFHHALRQLLPQARRSVVIQAPELDTPWLGMREVSGLLTPVLRANPRFHLRLLFNDARDAVQRGHQLIRSAQQFPSYLSLHQAQPEDQRPEAWLVIDERAVITRNDAQRFSDGTACPSAPLQARNLLQDFEERWQRARPAAQLRRLYL